MLLVDHAEARISSTPAQELPVPRNLMTDCGWLEVASFGPESGRSLVLMSHGMGSWSSLGPIGQRLAELDPGLRVIAWSRPGSGNSPAGNEPPAGDPLRHEAEVVVPALLGALGITSADFLGHADGATVAMIFASLFPSRVRKVISIAPYAFSDASFSCNGNLLPARERDSGLSDRLDANHADPEATYARWRRRRLEACARQWSALDLVSDMVAPLLLIQGTRDEFVAPDQASAIADAVSGPVNWVLLREQGHFLHHDVPEQVVRLVSSHLSARSGSFHG
jgi:pimeloyl-ACP methyl ester carboxylesterase